MVKELAVCRRATPTPEQHLLRDDLMATLGLFDDVAAAKEQQRGLGAYLAGTNDGGAGCPLILPGKGVGHD